MNDFAVYLIESGTADIIAKLLGVFLITGILCNVSDIISNIKRRGRK